MLMPCPGVESSGIGPQDIFAEPISETSTIQIHFNDQQPLVVYQVAVEQVDWNAASDLQLKDGLKHSLEDCPPPNLY
jgi:hypothetical protein